MGVSERIWVGLVAVCVLSLLAIQVSSGPAYAFSSEQTKAALAVEPAKLTVSPPDHNLSGSAGKAQRIRLAQKLEAKEIGQGKVGKKPGKGAKLGGEAEDPAKKLAALDRAMIRAAIAYARGGMENPEAYNLAYDEFKNYEMWYDDDNGPGGKALLLWLKTQSIYYRTGPIDFTEKGLAAYKRSQK
jgi:hypothetical protein